MPGGECGLYPSVIEARKKRKEQEKEYTQVAFTRPQERRIREIVKKEPSKQSLMKEINNDLRNHLESSDSVKSAKLSDAELQDIQESVIQQYSTHDTQTKG